jgi:hypothetical protein
MTKFQDQQLGTASTLDCSTRSKEQQPPYKAKGNIIIKRLLIETLHLREQKLAPSKK